MSALLTILEQFQLGGTIVAVEPFGRGNIHATYRSSIQGQTRQYVHQKLNTCVFANPENVMANMDVVTRHLREQFARQPMKRRRETLEIIPTHDGKLVYEDDQGNFWRTTVCIPNTITPETIQNREHAYEVGRTLGEFQRLVADIPPHMLHDTLPGFHHTPSYYDDLLAACSGVHPDPMIEQRKHAAEVRTLCQQIQGRAALVSLLSDAWQAGRLRARVAHNDPKVNNMVLDAETQQGIGMIDLDTVKAGLIHFDYGDCLRSAANPAGEEAENSRQVYFDAAIFEAVSRGYLTEARAFLTVDDCDLLVDAVKIITLEQAIRFLTDYVRGDTYYHTTYPAHNLNRARVQWALFQSIVHQEPALRTIVQRFW